MSVIDTPPPNRFPVEVHVGEYDADVVSGAIRREMERGGQIYFVSNRVKSIDDAVERVRMAAPEARVEVALHATRAAVEEGIVPGGGTALVNAIDAVEALDIKGDERVGALIIRRALESPMRQIATNAGQDGSVILQNVRSNKSKSYGYNAATDTYEDLVQAGVIDPKKVVRVALQNASSVASLLLSTDALVSDLPEKTESAGAAHAH